MLRGLGKGGLGGGRGKGRGGGGGGGGGEALRVVGGTKQKGLQIWEGTRTLGTKVLGDFAVANS